MKVYVIMRRKDKSIISIHGYEKPIEEIKALIDKWENKDHYPELIEDEKTLEIVRFLNRFDNEYMESDQQKLLKYESVIEDIKNTIERL